MLNEQNALGQEEFVRRLLVSFSYHSNTASYPINPAEQSEDNREYCHHENVILAVGGE